MTYYTITIFPEEGKSGKSTGRKYKTEAGANRRARALSMTNASVMVRRDDHDDDYPDTIYSSAPLCEWEHGAIVRDYSSKRAGADEAKEHRDRCLEAYDQARKGRAHVERYAREHGEHALRGNALDEMRKREEAAKLAYLEARDMLNAAILA